MFFFPACRGSDLLCDPVHGGEGRGEQLAWGEAPSENGGNEKGRRGELGKVQIACQEGKRRKVINSFKDHGFDKMA